MVNSGRSILGLQGSVSRAEASMFLASSHAERNCESLIRYQDVSKSKSFALSKIQDTRVSAHLNILELNANVLTIVSTTC